MNALEVKSQTVKGYGAGREAVMGRLKSISQLRRKEVKVSDEHLGEWEDLSRAIGISVSRIGELKEYVREIASADLLSRLDAMLSFLRSREFLAEARDMIDGGICAAAAVEHIDAEYESDVAVNETCLLLLNVLRGAVGEYLQDDGIVIALSRERLDGTDILSIVRAEISGLVCVGDKDCLARSIADLLKLPALFVSEEDADKLICGERAILSPESSSLTVAPDIEAVDKFLSLIKDDSPDEPSGSFFGEVIYRVLDLKMQQSCGFLAELQQTDRSEDELFLIYRRVAERAHREAATVIVRSGMSVYDHLRAILRAAVYGRLSVAVSARSGAEYEGICQIFACVCEELSREGREYEDRVALGAVIDSIGGALLVDALAKSADFLLIDATSLSESLTEAEREVAAERLTEMMFSIAHKDMRRLIAFGDMRVLSEKIGNALEKYHAAPVECLLAGG